MKKMIQLILVMTLFIPITLCANKWHFDLGTSYAVPFGYHTTGNLLPTDQKGDATSVVGADLQYNNNWTLNAALGYTFTSWFDLDLNYEYLPTEINTKQPISPTGRVGPASYTANLYVNTFLVSGRFFWPSYLPYLGATRGYIDVGVGTANHYLSHQEVFLTGGTQIGHMANHNRWQFAYEGAVGLVTSLSCHWRLDYGVRYTNYGTYNSGTNVVDFAPIQTPVQAHLWAVAPYISLSRCF